VDDKTSLIGAWSGHVNHFNFRGVTNHRWNGWS